MKFWIANFKVDRSLDYERIRPYLELEYKDDIEPDIYKLIDTELIECEDYKSLVDTLNKNEKYELSDIVSWIYDLEEEGVDKEASEKFINNLNYLIHTHFGFDELAIDSGKIVEFTYKELST